jgi:hypothetical protein
MADLKLPRVLQPVFKFPAYLPMGFLQKTPVIYFPSWVDHYSFFFICKPLSKLYCEYLITGPVPCWRAEPKEQYEDSGTIYRGPLLWPRGFLAVRSCSSLFFFACFLIYKMGLSVFYCCVLWLESGLSPAKLMLRFDGHPDHTVRSNF